MARNHEIRVSVSEEESKKIKKKAEAVGMTQSTLLRYIGLNCTVKVIIEE